MMIGDVRREREDCQGLGSFTGDGDVGVVGSRCSNKNGNGGRWRSCGNGHGHNAVVDAVCCCFGDFIPHRPPPQSPVTQGASPSDKTGFLMHENQKVQHCELC